ncbi:MAG TPA: class II aldolase/adducin family protein [Acidobacteriaceae bacterium]|nr:class II aldolase/adducin family protein [Acidobacteriaceae bacterium]
MNLEPTRQATRAMVKSIVSHAVLQCVEQGVRSSSTGEDPLEIFHSPATQLIKEEIVRTGHKLWQRQYVDGNGGNISARISKNYVICTPTLLSKGDLHVDDLALVDLENRRLCGDRPHTSELLLHLEIYKTVPQARAVVHCHPPYSTAHAIAGVVPQPNLVPEQEVFVGPVAITPYETPGTPEFARTIAPVAKNHNTILLTNHGLVCWGDTVTHAEWYVEVMETYCKTVMVASQLRPRLPEIPPEKIVDLLALKRRIGMSLPDARFPATPAVEAIIDEEPARAFGNAGPGSAEVEKLVGILTEQVVAFLEKH